MTMLLENFIMSLQAIRANKMRSLLTMLGVIIGISSVITIVSIGDSMRNFMTDQYKDVGINRAMVYTRPLDGFYSDSDYFTVDDLDIVLEAMNGDLAYADLNGWSNGTIKRKSLDINVEMQEVAKHFESIANVKIIEGRMINDADINGRRPHIVLPEKTALEIFGTAKCTGKVIEMEVEGERRELTVVGVYRKEMSAASLMLLGNPTAYVPYSYIRNADNHMTFYLNVYFADDADKEAGYRRLTNVIARMKNRQPEEIRMHTVAEEMQQVDMVLGSLSLAVGAIAAISLLVGGIGIMNIMLVSVTERTREIGIRKALGAQPWDIKFQFLTESAIISAAGGIIGTTFGLATVLILGKVVDIAVVVNPGTVLLAVAFSAAVGIGFGFYPASKAANADPIEALRYE